MDNIACYQLTSTSRVTLRFRNPRWTPYYQRHHTEERVLWDSGTGRATSTAGHTLRLDSRISVAGASGAQQCETTHPKFARRKSLGPKETCVGNLFEFDLMYYYTVENRPKRDFCCGSRPACRTFESTWRFPAGCQRKARWNHRRHRRQRV